MSDSVDLARHAACGVEHSFDGIGFEVWQLGRTCHLQPMLQVGFRFGSGERHYMMLCDDALCQRFVHGHGEAAAQFGQPDQHHAHTTLRVELEVGQQPEVFEHFVAQMMGFVDDQHRQLLFFLRQANRFAADDVPGAAALTLFGQGHGVGNDVQGVEHAAGGQRCVTHPVQSGMQIMVLPR